MQVRKLQGQQAAIAGEARNLIAKSRAKEAANAKLWEQVGCRAAAVRGAGVSSCQGDWRHRPKRARACSPRAGCMCKVA
jgi:hypothetical protein